MIKILTLLILFIVAGCGGTAEKTAERYSARPVYNQAYQENYQSDTIPEILQHASYAYVLIDPFEDETWKQVRAIQAKGNEVGGYISAGTGESHRNDFEALKPYLSTTAWPEWPDEYFVSETTTGIVTIMKKRIDKMADWGFDWVEFDNMDWLDNDTRKKYDLAATVEQAHAYINTLCDYTHSKGMKCMAKNTVEGFEHFDGVLYESYSNEKNWWDLAGLQHFLKAKKLVIINHYDEADCDAVYAEYKRFYKSDTISFICEERSTRRYKHYNEKR